MLAGRQGRVLNVWKVELILLRVTLFLVFHTHPLILNAFHASMELSATVSTERECLSRVLNDVLHDVLVQDYNRGTEAIEQLE